MSKGIRYTDEFKRDAKVTGIMKPPLRENWCQVMEIQLFHSKKIHGY